MVGRSNLPRPQGTLTLEKVRGRFTYDSASGHLIYQYRWGKRTPGEIAGRMLPCGYVQICVDRRYVLAHRLVWLHVTGKWPSAEIDHINGIKSDNRIENLREATPSQNRVALTPKRISKSGVRGVYPHHGRWRAGTKVAGKKIHIGMFETKEEAVTAYRAEVEKHFGTFVPWSSGR